MRMTNRYSVYLIVIVLFAILLRLIFFSGIDTSDSVYYTKFANDILNDKFPSETTQLNARIGLLIPVAISYSIFGVNDFSSTLFPLLASIFGIILIFHFGKFLFNEKVGLVAAFLLSFFPLDVLYSTRLLSDLPSAFFSGLSIFLFLKAEKIVRKSNSYLFYILSGASLGIAFTIREMAIIMLLFFLVYVLYKKEFKWSYILIGTGFLLILIIETGFFYYYTGNPFFKLEGADYALGTIVHDDLFYGRLSFPKFFVTWPYVVFGNIQQGYFFTFISLAALYWLFHRKKETDYLLIWFLSILLYFYFGTISFKRYAPVLAVARYLNYITYPALILLAAFLMEQQKIIKKLFLPFTIIFLLFTSIGIVYLDNSRNSLDGLRKVYSEVKAIEKPIYTDYRSMIVLNYISDYKNNLNLVDLDSNPKKLKNVKDVYIVINNKMIRDLMAANKKLAFLSEIKDIPDNWIKIKEMEEENIIIYYAK